MQKGQTRNIELVNDASDNEDEHVIHKRISGQWDNINTAINNKLKSEQRRETQTKKVLLISTRSSGNSTIFQQVITRYGEGPDSNNSSIVHQIREQCFETALILSKMINDNKSEKQLLSLSIQNEHDLTQIGIIIHNIWQNQQIQQQYLYKYVHSKYGDKIHENMDYFFNKITSIMSPEYEFELQELLRSKQSYNHMKEFLYESNEHKYDKMIFVDVPTKLIKNAEIKRGYMFSNIDSVLFIVGLSDYCVYRNDVKQNAMRYSMELFENILHEKWIKGKDIILIFNKYDIFFELIKRGIPLSVCFDELNDGWDPTKDYGTDIRIIYVIPWMIRNLQQSVPLEIVKIMERYLLFAFDETQHDHQTVDKCVTNAMHFIKDKFQELNKDQQRRIFFFSLDATDDHNVGRVLWDIQNIILPCRLAKGGS